MLNSVLTTSQTLTEGKHLAKGQHIITLKKRPRMDGGGGAKCARLRYQAWKNKSLQIIVFI